MAHQREKLALRPGGGLRFDGELLGAGFLLLEIAVERIQLLARDLALGDVLCDTEHPERTPLGIGVELHAADLDHALRSIGADHAVIKRLAGQAGERFSDGAFLFPQILRVDQPGHVFFPCVKCGRIDPVDPEHLVRPRNPVRDNIP